ncbi:phosphoenolpyruvate synthase [Nocardioides sp.]|uniref:phosphoenolpyruvate synthase n=1 Tax=Nocardioides sp. TaxID=35761 RepID=UPI0037837E90
MSNAHQNSEQEALYVRNFVDLGAGDIPVVGGKNASLGEMLSNLAGLGITVPDGFATTTNAFHLFMGVGQKDGLAGRIAQLLRDLDIDDLAQLSSVGSQIRSLIANHPFPSEVEAAIRVAFQSLTSDAHPSDEPTFAVRSSATAEDLPDASFAGQQETMLNVQGIDDVLIAIREVFASLYNDRAIAYRTHHQFPHESVAMSAGVQHMVRSDIGSAGVMFTVDTESGFTDTVLITSAYGLGEGVVQGAVNPDEFHVYKPAVNNGRPAILRRTVGDKATKMVYAIQPSVGHTTEFTEVTPRDRIQFSITDDEVIELARQALTIEQHYGRPMDIEWAKDGVTGEINILQARPETVQSRRPATLERFVMSEPDRRRATVRAVGRAVGQKIGAGRVRVLNSPADMHDFRAGEVLVADMTDPDWEPIMKRAAAIVTNRGGRTCHAAIIARELGIPAVVGTGSATRDLEDGDEVTVSCAEGELGVVLDGTVDFDVQHVALDEMPDVPVQIMMNVGNPDQAFTFARLPNSGVGLARLEFIINRQIGIHPRALLDMEANPEVLEASLRARIQRMTAAYPSPRDFFVQRVVEGVATLAAAFAPDPVVVRMSDFKTNEYARLVGGPMYEPHEENPMLGYRGASRYLSADFVDCFVMECEAIRYVRNEMGLTNVKVMVPFVRTLAEADGVIELLAEHGLRRGHGGLEIIMMCELPANAVLADQFLDRFDGFSIGSNDLTQLTLGLDRDSEIVARAFDERDPAVLRMIEMAIRACRGRGKYVGICGQGPSDHPELAAWLVEQRVDSISLNPDTVIDTWLALASAGVADGDVKSPL